MRTRKYLVAAAFAVAGCKNKQCCGECKDEAKAADKAAGCCANCPAGCTCGGTGECCKAT